MCGIIAKEGNDILEVNGCTKRKNVYHLSIKQYVVDGATIHTDTSGKKFYVSHYTVLYAWILVQLKRRY